MKRLLILLLLLISFVVPGWIHAQDSPIVTSIAWSHDGTLLAVGTYAGVQIFSMATDTPEFLWAFETEQSVNVLQFSPSDDWLAAGLGNGAGGSQGMVSVWIATTGNPVTEFEANEFAVYALAFSPDGQYLVTGGGYFPTRAGGDYRVRTWNTDNWETVPNMESNGRGVISALDFAMDGIFMIYSSGQGPVNIVDIQTNDIVASVYQEGADCIVFDEQTDRLILSFYRSVQIWELRNEPEIHLVRQAVWDTAYSENLSEFLLGEYIIGCSLDYFITSSEDSILRVRNDETGDIVFSYVELDRRFIHAALSPDTTWLAFISNTGGSPFSENYVEDHRIGIWILGQSQPLYLDLK